MVLVGLFTLAFTVAIAAQIKAHHDNAAQTIVGAQASAAGLIGERVNANLATALGVTAGVAELTRTAGSDAYGAASALAHAPGAVAGAVINGAGAVEASTDPAQARLALAAVRAARGANDWIGVPDMGTLPSAPVILRRAGDLTLVSVLDPKQLLPNLDAQSRVIIATSGGRILYVSQALAQAGQLAQRQVQSAGRQTPTGTIIEGREGASFVVAAGEAQIAGFEVIAAAPAPSALALWMEAVMRFSLVAAAPLAAIGVLYLLMRQNAQRASLAEAEVDRVETHFRIAADGAKVGILEWRPDAGEMQFSEQAVRLLGAPSDTMLLRDFLGLVLPDDRFSVEEQFHRARQSGALDARFRVQRGSALAWIEAHGAAVEDASGRAETRVFGTVVDSTQHHEAEALASRLERQLRAAHPAAL